LASEVKDPGPALLKVTFILIPIVILVYVVPLLAALSQDADYASYKYGCRGVGHCRAHRRLLCLSFMSIFSNISDDPEIFFKGRHI
jgi:hypothetical protein